MDAIDRIVEKARKRAKFRVAALRLELPGRTPAQLGERLIDDAALRAGAAGAVTGTLGLLSLPLGLPAGVAWMLLIEAELLFSLLEVYELPTQGPAGRLRLYALWAGAGFADAAKSVGLRAGAGAIGRVLRESLPARLIRRLNPALLKAILRRLGLSWLPGAVRLWPLLGAPIAFSIDRATVKSLGKSALAALEQTAAAPVA